MNVRRREVLRGRKVARIQRSRPVFKNEKIFIWDGSIAKEMKRSLSMCISVNDKMVHFIDMMEIFKAFDA